MRMLLVFAVVAEVTVIPGTVAPAKDYPIRAVPLTSVTINDAFWAPKREINRTVTIPHIMQQNELTGRVDNFLKAATRDSVCPAICVTEGCDYTTDMEPDQDAGYCEVCGGYTVTSALVLAGLI